MSQKLQLCLSSGGKKKSLQSSLHPSDQAAKSRCSTRANLTCKNIPGSLHLPATPNGAPSWGENVQPYLAMGSLQRSQCLSPPFLFALRNWSPCLRHLLSLQPVKSSWGFRLTSSSAHRTRPPREGQGAHPPHKPPPFFPGPSWR